MLLVHRHKLLATTLLLATSSWSYLFDFGEAPFVNFKIQNLQQYRGRRLKESSVVASTARRSFLPKLISLRQKHKAFSVIEQLHVNLDFSSKTHVDGLVHPERPNELNINGKMLFDVDDGFSEVFLHEYFHLTHYATKTEESYWLREGLATWFASSQMNHSGGVFLQSAFRNVNTSLHLLPSNKKGDKGLTRPQRLALYGKSYLLLKYLSDTCLADLNTIEAQLLIMGYGSSDAELKLTGFKWLSHLAKQNTKVEDCQNFKNLFRSFAIELAANSNDLSLLLNSHEVERSDEVLLDSYNLAVVWDTPVTNKKQITRALNDCKNCELYQLIPNKHPAFVDIKKLFSMPDTKYLIVSF